MNNTWKINTQSVKFDSLKIGDFFCLSEGENNSIFLKINSFEEGATGYVCNAISLHGKDYEFDSADKVYKIQVPSHDTVIFIP